MADAEATKGPPKLQRPETTFKVPAKCRVFPADPQTLTMVPISLQEELDAHAVVASQGKGVAALNYEMAKRSVSALDGKAIDWSGTGPEWLERASPQVRDLLVEGFAKVSRATQEDVRDFLASAVTKSA